MGKLGRTTCITTLIAAVGIFACGVTSKETPNAGRDPVAERAKPADIAAMAAPPLIMVGTDRSGHSRFYRVEPDGAWPAPFATVLHRADATPRAAQHPSRATLLAASRGQARDRSFDYVLFRVDADGTSEQVATSLTHAGRPHVDDAGRILVVRGEAGPAIAGETRVDRFSLDEVEPTTGTLRRWHDFEGHHLHLAATRGGEAYLYRVGPRGADLVAVDAGGRLRVIRRSVLPYARDFSLDDDGRLIFRQRHPDDTQRWQALRVDAHREGASPELLYEDDTFALAPHAWPGGGLLINPRREGMALHGAHDPVSAHPMGPGVDLLRATSANRRFVALLHTRTDALPQPFIIDRTTGRVSIPDAPPGERIAIAGFEGGGR